MTFKFRHYDKIVGIFVILGLLLLLVVIIFLFLEKKWFDFDKLELYTSFDKGDNLSKGMDVQMNGVTVGKIDSVEFADYKKIDVRFVVFSKYRDMVHENSSIMLVTSLLGGGHLAIVRTNDDIEMAKPVADGTYLVATSVGDGLQDIIDNVGKLTSDDGKIAKILTELGAFAARLNNAAGTVPALLGPMITRDLNATLSNVNKITDDMTTLSSLLRTSSPNIRNVIGSAEKSLDEANRLLITLQNYLGTSPNRYASSGRLGDVGTIQHNQRAELYP